MFEQVQTARRALPLLFIIFTAAAAAPRAGGEEPARKPERLRVMSFNLWHGGDAGNRPLEDTAAVIRAARADVVGVQESHGHAPRSGEPRPDNSARLAEMLGWKHFDQGGRAAVLSRGRIVSAKPRKWGVKLETPAGGEIYLFNAHFAHAPYQPYQLLEIPYHNGPFLKTEAEAVAAAREARGGQVERMLGEVREVQEEGLPIFLTGDFNEPSHRDWTPRAARAGLCPLPVAWPTTKRVEEAGFRDGYREAHPDEVKQRGLTWTPTTKIDDPADRHDRIDFVFVRGAGVRVLSAEVVGESRAWGEIVLDPYPSDHRAVVVEVELTR